MKQKLLFTRRNVQQCHATSRKQYSTCLHEPEATLLTVILLGIIFEADEYEWISAALACGADLNNMGVQILFDSKQSVWNAVSFMSSSRHQQLLYK